jgi:hypothetical protein
LLSFSLRPDRFAVSAESKFLLLLRLSKANSWTAIRESWVRIFENTKNIKFVITDIKIKASEKIAIVVCLENIDSVIEDENSIRMGVIATNIFEKQNVNNNKNNNEWANGTSPWFCSSKLHGS